ncbi:MAG: histidine triad nucleotide-binding protein [Patescibacteria group bacterium]
MEDCLFCKIIKMEVRSDVILEGGSFLAFKDIHPKADVHILIIPKKHIASVNDTTTADVAILGEMFLAAKEVAEKLGVSVGYKLQVNVGKDGGQEIEHIHMHLLSGEMRKEVSSI